MGWPLRRRRQQDFLAEAVVGAGDPSRGRRSVDAAWSQLVYSTDGDAAISLKNFRKDVIIELLNEQGTIAKVYNVFRCWVSEYSALPELDSNGTGVAMEVMVLQNEGWTRDLAVGEPPET